MSAVKRRKKPCEVKYKNCGRMWAVSIYQPIPKSGYICPTCAGKPKAGGGKAWKA